MTISHAGAPVADFEAVFQSVTYDNADQDPDETARIINFVANDGTANSNVGSVTLGVTPANDKPVLTAGDTLAYDENDAATAIDTTVTVADDVHLDLALVPERSRDDVAHRMALGLLVGQEPKFDLLVDPRMIARQLP